MDMQTNRRALLGAMALAPIVGATLSPAEAVLPSIWQMRMSAYLSAKRASDLYHSTHVGPTWAAEKAGGPAVRKDVWDESDRLSEAAAESESAVQCTPAPDLAAVLWKLDQLFDADHRSEPDYIDPWHAKFTDSIRADVARLARGGLS